MPLMDDALWEIIPRPIPVEARRGKDPERKDVCDRAAPTGNLFVLEAGTGGRISPRNWSGSVSCLFAADGNRRCDADAGSFNFTKRQVE